MSSKLMQAFREQMQTGKKAMSNQEAIGDILYSTGFANIDYLNGYMVHVKNEKEDYYYPQLGIPDGKSLQLIGLSHVGKSTLMIQTASNVIRNFQNGGIWHADLEGGTNDHRIEILSRMSQSELSNKYHYQDFGITTEVFYEQIKWIRDHKIQHRDDYTYDTGIVNFRGNPIFKFEPSIYMIDSIPMLLPDDVLEQDKMSGQMSTTSSVKMNTAVFRRIQQMCKEANIIIISINHILEDVQINPMMHKKTKIKGLKQGERLPGGSTNQYLSNTMLRIDAGTTLKPEEGFGIDGFIASIQTVKSRTNASLKTIPMVFDKDTGFSNELSLLQLLKANNKVKGAGSYLYLGDRSDIKFSQKTFLESLHKYPELGMELIKEAYPILDSYMSKDLDLGYDDEQDENSLNLNDLIKQMAMGKMPVVEMKSVSEEVVPKDMKVSSDDVLDILDGEINDTEIPTKKKK